jgi:hypothetical protein
VSAGSCSDGALECRCRMWCTEFCVDVEEGREISCPKAGSEGFSSKVGATLNEVRSRTCNADRGRIGSIMAGGRERNVVASVNDGNCKN